MAITTRRDRVVGPFWSVARLVTIFGLEPSGGTCRGRWDSGSYRAGVSFAQRGERQNLALRFAHRAGLGSRSGFSTATCKVRPSGYDDYSPCSLDDLRGIGLDYWALGHVHARMVLSGRSGSDEPWVVYPGNLQARSPKPSERGMKGAVVAHVHAGASQTSSRWAATLFASVSSRSTSATSLILAECGPGSSPASRDGLASSDGRGHSCSAHSWWARASCTLTSAAGTWKDLLVALRGDFAEYQPFCWWDSIDHDRSRPTVDIDAARAGSDFAADLIRLADQPRPSSKAMRVQSSTSPPSSPGTPRNAQGQGASSSNCSVPELVAAELVDRALVLALGALEGDGH